MTWLIFLRDVQLAFRRGGGAGAGIAFAVMVFAVFAFTLGPEMLAASAGRVLCAAVLLSCLLTLPSLFEQDREDGSLEQYLLTPGGLEWLVLGKLAAFWLAACAPLVLLAPFLALLSGMEAGAATGLGLALLLATPALCALGALSAALALNLRGGGLTLTLITLPLYLPPLIFLAGAAENASSFAFLGGMSLIAVPLSCFLCGGLLRLSYE